MESGCDEAYHPSMGVSSTGSTMRFGLQRDDTGRWSLLSRRAESLKRETPESPFAFAGQLGFFWDQLALTGFSPRMTDFIWVADRCVQLNAQQIAHMPLRFNPGAPNSREPAWISNPDPIWYPNGISDAIHSAVDDYYRFGDAFLYVTSFYADGMPAAWTVLDNQSIDVEARNGRRVFKQGSRELDPQRVVQITRNPRGQLRGTSALRSYSEMIAASNAATVAAATSMGNMPPLVLQATQKMTGDQADALLDAWRAKALARQPGEPVILDPRLDLKSSGIGWSPSDLTLVESQEFNARILASAFGVPPFLINVALTGGLTYQNPAMLGEYWWRTELFSTSSSFARALTSQMLPRGSSVWFDPKHLTDELTAQGDPDESPAVKASPADQSNVAPLRPSMEVMA